MLFRSDRKSTRLNSSHTIISYAVFCLKKKKIKAIERRQRESELGGGQARIARTRARRGGEARSPRHHAEGKLTARERILFFFNNGAPPEIYPLSLHRPLPF